MDDEGDSVGGWLVVGLTGGLWSRESGFVYLCLYRMFVVVVWLWGG